MTTKMRRPTTTLPEDWEIVRWMGEHGVDHHPNHLDRIRRALSSEGLTLDDVELVVNQDRDWGERQEGRHPIGSKKGGFRLWMVEKSLQPA